MAIYVVILLLGRLKVLPFVLDILKVISPLSILTLSKQTSILSPTKNCSLFLVLYRENGVLYVQCLLNLKRDIQYKNQVFKAGKKNEEDLVEVDAVYEILRVNGNIKIFNGEKYVKLNLGQFSHIILNNKYIVEEVQVTVVKEEKVEVKVPEIQQPVVEEPKEVDNKKKRHKNNQNQGDDK